MNLKTILAAAVVIVIAGVGTGVAIGGKTETKTVTTTVAKTETTTVTAPTTTTDTATTGTTDTTPVEPGAENAPEEPIPSDGELVQVPERFSNTTSIESNETAQLRLGSPAPGFDISLSTDYDDTPLRYGFEITNPDPESPRTFVTTIGFAKNTTSGYSAKVYIRYDSFSTDPVQQFTLQSSGARSVKRVSIPVQGKTNLSVQITTDDRTWPSDGIVLSMLEPGFNPTQ